MTHKFNGGGVVRRKSTFQSSAIYSVSLTESQWQQVWYALNARVEDLQYRVDNPDKCLDISLKNASYNLRLTLSARSGVESSFL